MDWWVTQPLVRLSRVFLMSSNRLYDGVKKRGKNDYDTDKIEKVAYRHKCVSGFFVQACEMGRL